MNIITSNAIADALMLTIPTLATHVPADILAAMEKAREEETNERAREVLNLLVENAKVAASEHMPICQDTGTVWVCLEIGGGIELDGNIFAKVDSVVEHAYTANKLRLSVVKDALFDRTNTFTNTPAQCEIRYAADDFNAVHLHIMLKGGGSDNASRVMMLNPADGKEGVIQAVLDCVKEKAINACPPLVVGVGVGSTFDKVGNLSKRALMRPLDKPSPRAEINEFEEELLERINELGIGAGGFGGNHTALGVRVMTEPCHIASLPVAINMGCCALRRTTIEL